jgi:hypothetical protein
VSRGVGEEDEVDEGGQEDFSCINGAEAGRQGGVVSQSHVKLVRGVFIAHRAL